MFIKQRKIKYLRKTLVAIIVLLILAISAGCEKSYILSSNDVYASGRRLNGNGIVNATLTLSDSTYKDDTLVELFYADRTYKGTVSRPYVLWETDPYIFADSSSMYTEIYGSGNTINLTFHALVNGVWVESRQIYTAK